jgi:hypothetical protein
MFRIGHLVLLKIIRADGSTESGTCNTERVVELYPIEEQLFQLLLG